MVVLPLLGRTKILVLQIATNPGALQQLIAMQLIQHNNRWLTKLWHHPGNSQ